MRRNVFGGLVLLLLGVLFLADTTGWLSVDVWTLFWPLLLIVLGLSLLIGRAFSAPDATTTLSMPLEEARKARIHLKHGAGRLTLSSGAAPDALLSGNCRGGADLEREVDGATVNVWLRQSAPAFPFFTWDARPLDWDLVLNASVLYALDLQTGAGASEIDLAPLLVSDLHLETGASKSQLTLPRAAGFTRVELHAGVAALNVRVPEGVAAAINAKGGLAHISVDRDRFPRAGESYRSPDYETAENRVEIEIETGVGAVDVR
jgi:hypothetical protein